MTSLFLALVQYFTRYRPAAWGARKRLAGALPILALLFAPRPAAADPRVHLEVAHSTEATDCPDAAGLAATVGRALGRDALDPSADDAPLRFDVIFARLNGGYVATVRRSDPNRSARTLAADGPSCRRVADAVVVTLALMLDELAAEPRPAPTPVAVPPPPSMPDPVIAEHVEVRGPEPDTDPDPPVSRLKSRWYGWQTLLVDANATTFILWSAIPTGLGAQEFLLGSGVGGLVFGGPIVHAAHGRWGMGLADLGLRVGAVTAFALLGDLIGTATEHDTCGGSAIAPQPCVQPDFLGSSAGEGAVLGGLAGIIVASAIDSAALARMPARPEPDAASSISWLPSVSPTPHGATVGVVARF